MQQFLFALLSNRIIYDNTFRFKRSGPRRAFSGFPFHEESVAYYTSMRYVRPIPTPAIWPSVQHQIFLNYWGRFAKKHYVIAGESNDTSPTQCPGRI